MRDIRMQLYVIINNNQLAPIEIQLKYRDVAKCCHNFAITLNWKGNLHNSSKNNNNNTSNINNDSSFTISFSFFFFSMNRMWPFSDLKFFNSIHNIRNFEDTFQGNELNTFWNFMKKRIVFGYIFIEYIDLKKACSF